MGSSATRSHKPSKTIAVSKSHIALVRSLQRKKERDRLSLFVAEGSKTIAELLPHFGCQALFRTSGCVELTADNVVEVSRDELERLSLLQTPHDSLAILFKRPQQTVSFDDLVLALDGVQDPGNVGTIIRIADWYGIRHIVCGPDTADCYNPKTVQATMGSLARVNVASVADLAAWLETLPDGLPVYGTLLDGSDIYSQELQGHGIIVMGSEGRGISPAVRQLIASKLKINPYPTTAKTAESLNVAIATAITIAEFRRRTTT